MSSDKQETPVQKIVGILRESGADVYVVTVASPEGNGRMRALLGMNGSMDDIVELLASVIRRLVDGVKFPDAKAKHVVTAAVLARLTQAVIEGANGEVSSVDTL